jgi:D-glycero-D-manno-heptose 1,7-bisphosphate phosphatase
VVLDRDGTILVERHYLSRPEQVELAPNAAVGMRRLRELGFGLAVVTNQSGLSRGYFDESGLAQIHSRMQQLLADQGVSIDGIYVCPHLPEQECVCRKPRPALVYRAAAELKFDPIASIVVGDNRCDVQLGQRIGAVSVLVRTGYGARLAAEQAVSPDHVVDDLAHLAALLERTREVAA